MNTRWFEGRVKYSDATGKEIVESYLIDALSFTEAENKLIEEVSPSISGEFDILEVKKRRISELFKDEDGDKWYKCRVMIMTLDEKSGVEKRSACTIMVQADSLQDAIKNLEDGMKETMDDWEVALVQETSIVGLILNEPCKEEQQSESETEE